MKKALAVLVIMMVALVAVFAASTEKGPYTITLHQTVPTQEVMINVFYGKEEIKTVSEEITDLASGGHRDFSITLVGNGTADYTRNVQFEASDFLLKDSKTKADLSDGKNDRKVETTLAFTTTPANDGSYTLTHTDTDAHNQNIDVKYNKYHNIKEAVTVATGTISWGAKADLVAGYYESIITVTISGD